ncbi:hypothetical protein C8R44DRAFT_751943 [Mycena epipterygia]|nr:hypothetical protein C8R44DRAFT_751943 [Mycena epipterygia]
MLLLHEAVTLSPYSIATGNKGGAGRSTTLESQHHREHGRGHPRFLSSGKWDYVHIMAVSEKLETTLFFLHTLSFDGVLRIAGLGSDQLHFGMGPTQAFLSILFYCTPSKICASQKKVRMHVLSPCQLLSQSLVPLQMPFDHMLFEFRVSRERGSTSHRRLHWAAGFRTIIKPCITWIARPPTMSPWTCYRILESSFGVAATGEPLAARPRFESRPSTPTCAAARLRLIRGYWS